MSDADPHPTFGEALAALQAELPKLKKADKANVGKYSYTYLSLEDLIVQVQPLLSKHGLIWSAQPSGTQAEPTLAYSLVHRDTMEGFNGEMPLFLTDRTAQAYGSWITYCRRYAMLSVLNIATDDDDGQAAFTPAPRKAVLTESSLLPEMSQQNLAKKVQEAGLELTDVLDQIGARSLGAVTIGQAHLVREIIERDIAHRIAAEFDGKVEVTS